MTDFRPVRSSHAGADLEGLLLPLGPGPRPGVLIAPTIMGRSDLELGFARRLADLGYTAMVADLYGKVGLPREQCRDAMNALLADRALLQERLLALLEAFRAQPEVDAGRIAAIGYCFGGLCALDLARTGADVAGVASFHGLFTPPGNRDGTPIRAKVLALHGWDDPMAPPEAVEALAAELTAAGADWQIHAYGKTMHGFTNPNANAPESGLQYSATADRRSWSALENFLAEVLNEIEAT
ncbi:MAG: dienelactone hydrolase family protein [Alphaproteobacteria bacterium]|nr:dienelactone hydrolase family protein [Alphaproteobacteria bacterium]